MNEEKNRSNRSRPARFKLLVAIILASAVCLATAGSRAVFSSSSSSLLTPQTDVASTLPPSGLVAQAKASGAAFQAVTLFSVGDQAGGTVTGGFASDVVANGSILHLDSSAATAIIGEPSAT